MPYPTNYAGKLNPNEIFAPIFNMIISQEVFAYNIASTASELVNKNRVDGGLYGDTKLYYSTDVLRSYAWGGDSEAPNLLELFRPEAPQCDSITLDYFRQIRLTVDDYLSKRAWSTESAFSTFTSVMLGWMRKTKEICDATNYNTFIGTHETKEGKQYKTVTLPTDTNKEAENRLQAQTLAQEVADIIDDLKDISRDYNDYQNLRSYNEDDFYYVWNKKWLNKITKLDLPTIFHDEELIKHFNEDKLPARYFGNPVEKGTAIESDGLTYRSLIEQDVTLKNDYTYKGKTIKSGSKFHLFAGDLIPAGISLATTTAVVVPSYKENGNIVVKIVHKKAVPFMSAFEAGTSFFNERALTKTNFLTYGHNTLKQLHDKPFVTLEVTVNS